MPSQLRYAYLKSTLQPDGFCHSRQTAKHRTLKPLYTMRSDRVCRTWSVSLAFRVLSGSTGMTSSYAGHCVRVQPLSEAPLFKTPAQASKGMVCTNHPIASAAGVEMFAVVTRKHLLCTNNVSTPNRVYICMTTEGEACAFLARGETPSMPPSRPSSACPWLSL